MGGGVPAMDLTRRTVGATGFAWSGSATLTAKPEAAAPYRAGAGRHGEAVLPRPELEPIYEFPDCPKKTPAEYREDQSHDLGLREDSPSGIASDLAAWSELPEAE
jgi:hypothetical protein